MSGAEEIEEIVLLDAAGAAIGTAPKAASHHRDTPYHLAFSCYIVDALGRVLITRRALDKTSFPGVWTNSCCGHPAPGEGLRDAVRRRVRTELGIELGELTLILPDFDYRATAADGTVEHERCPVVRALAGAPAMDTGAAGTAGTAGAASEPAAATVRPEPAEVAAAEWRDWSACLELAGHPEASPWYRLQMKRLVPLGSPLEWPAAATGLLPPAIGW